MAQRRKNAAGGTSGGEQAMFLVITVSMLVAIFVVDLLYVRLDPRVRR